MGGSCGPQSAQGVEEEEGSWTCAQWQVPALGGPQQGPSCPPQCLPHHLLQPSGWPSGLRPPPLPLDAASSWPLSTSHRGSSYPLPSTAYGPAVAPQHPWANPPVPQPGIQLPLKPRPGTEVVTPLPRPESLVGWLCPSPQSPEAALKSRPEPDLSRVSCITHHRETEGTPIFED